MPGEDIFAHEMTRTDRADLSCQLYDAGHLRIVNSPAERLGYPASAHGAPVWLELTGENPATNKQVTNALASLINHVVRERLASDENTLANPSGVRSRHHFTTLVSGKNQFDTFVGMTAGVLGVGAVGVDNVEKLPHPHRTDTSPTYAVVGDMISRGLQTSAVIDKVKKYGTVTDVFFLIDRGDGGVERIEREHGIGVHTVFSIGEVFESLKHHNRLSRGQVENLGVFLSDRAAFGSIENSSIRPPVAREPGHPVA